MDRCWAVSWGSRSSLMPSPSLMNIASVDAESVKPCGTVSGDGCRRRIPIPRCGRAWVLSTRSRTARHRRDPTRTSPGHRELSRSLGRPGSTVSRSGGRKGPGPTRRRSQGSQDTTRCCFLNRPHGRSGESDRRGLGTGGASTSEAPSQTTVEYGRGLASRLVVRSDSVAAATQNIFAFVN